MGQSNISFSDKAAGNAIIIKNENLTKVAQLLQSYLNKSGSKTFLIQNENNSNAVSSIHLIVEKPKTKIDENKFVIKSNEKDVFLIAPNEKLLRYAAYTLLEDFGFRKFTTQDLYVPTLKEIVYSKNSTKNHSPSFEYRVLFYPDAFDEDFRDWHKLDWHLNDFTIWGHSFDKLLSAKEFFKTNPEYFAFYEGKRRPESLCMTNENVTNKVIKKMTDFIAKNPAATFTSVSQNDDAVFCECSSCNALNKKLGGAQGSLYFFLNKIAKHFPETKIVTLAYQQTFKAPISLKIQPNIYTLICPIDLNRGKSIQTDVSNKPFFKIMQDWNKVTSNLYLWDYTVQFSNYLSPFPNIHTFSENYKFFKQNNVKGLFVQGYADVPGDFSELRQYLLAKLLWNTETDIKATTADFLRGYYGNAAHFVQEYLNALQQNQEKTNRFLDIYSGPIQNRNTFLSVEAMDQYDRILDQASAAVDIDSILYERIEKLRLALEFVFFEQSKFYGADKHGMFSIDANGNKIVKEGLNERVFLFVSKCKKLEIYELSEDGILPTKYYENWLEIAENTTVHLGEKIAINFLSSPSSDYSGKGKSTLVDGIRGHKDYNINWVGWYGNDPEIELLTKGIDFNCIQLNFLNNQRNWIFTPKAITIFGYINGNWIAVKNIEFDDLIENVDVKSNKVEIVSKRFSNFEKIKIVVQNQKELPVWRNRKNKKPMVMIDEIELYNK